MSLHKIVEEIKKVRVFANEDVSSGPSETLNGRRGRKAQAIEQLKRLKRDYKKELLRSAVFIVSTGEDQDKFSQAATDDFACFAADSDEFYKDLAGRVPPTLYLGKEGVSNVFDVLGRHLEDKMMELDINEYNQLIFKAHHAQVVKSADEFTQVIKDAINQQIGSEIVGIQAIQSLLDKAVEKNHAAQITPVVLNTKDENFALSLMKDLQRLNPKVFLVVSGNASAEIKAVEDAQVLDEASKKNVGAVLTKIKKSLKTK